MYWAWDYCIASLIFLTMHCCEVFATELPCSLCQFVLEVLGGPQRSSANSQFQEQREKFLGHFC